MPHSIPVAVTIAVGKLILTPLPTASFYASKPQGVSLDSPSAYNRRRLAMPTALCYSPLNMNVRTTAYYYYYGYFEESRPGTPLL